MLVCVYNFDLRRRNRYAQLAYWTFFVVLVVVSGLRYRIGTDSVVYEANYENVPTMMELDRFKFNSTRFEPAFMVFQSITRTFSPDFMWLQFLHAIVVNAVFFWFISKNAKHKFLTLTFFYIVLYLNLNTQVMREALAVCLFLLSWPFFRDNKWIQYYLLTGLATFFHTSAFVLLVLPLFCLPGLRELFVIGKRTIIICVIILAVGIFIQTRFSSILSLMAVTERMMDRVHEYSIDRQSGNLLNITGIIGLLIQYCIYPLIALYFANQWKLRKFGKKNIKLGIRKNKENEEQHQQMREDRIERRRSDRWQMMVLLGVYFMIFSIPIFIFRRYFNYFGIFCLTTVATWAYSELIKGRKRIRLSRITWTIVILPFFLLNLYAYNASASKGGTMKFYQVYYPYHTRLDRTMDPERETIFRYLNAR